MRVLHSNQGFYRAYDVTLLPVTCLDTHACHLVAVSRNAGYKTDDFHGDASCLQMVDTYVLFLSSAGPLTAGI